MNKFYKFKDYNDYELMYLYRDGNELAYNVLFSKYELLLYKLIHINCDYSYDRCMDISQDCRMIIHSCLLHYNPQRDAKLYTYIYVSIIREINRLKRNSYYSNGSMIVSDNIAYFEGGSKTICGRDYFSDELEIKIFDECIIGNTSLTQFAKENDITYSNLYRIYKRMLSELKNMLTK